ncbi:MAG: ketoacyl-ACP synthase III [Planctomycetota bacterium]
MKYAALGPIAVHLPEKVECSADLQAEFPKWDVALIQSKTGIDRRHIAAPGETSADLGVKAAEKLLKDFDVDPASIDYLLFCTQTPDYPLPTTACLIQDRLGLPTHCGAVDFNQGCSGYVYGLSLADGLIRTGTVKRILFVTAETYTKFIHPTDRSMRTIFGDAATATLIDAADDQSLWGFKYGTDGSGANTLIVGKGGFRPEEDAIPPRHRKRWPSEIYMDGPGIINFGENRIPSLVDAILEMSSMSMDSIKYLLFHQATRKMLERLHEVLNVNEEKMPIMLEEVGNTVSSTLPILINRLRSENKMSKQDKHMLVGFGVGLSWAGCVWQDRHQP